MLSDLAVCFSCASGMAQCAYARGFRVGGDGGVVVASEAGDAATHLWCLGVGEPYA